MFHRFALLIMLFFFHLTASAAVPGKIAIIKADDLVDKGLMGNYQNFLDASKSHGVKVSMGIECRAFSGSHAKQFMAFMNANSDRQVVEYWHHGWDHDPADYIGTGYAYQKQHFTNCENVMHDKLGYWPIALGAPGNAYDADTVRVMNVSPHMRIFFSRFNPVGGLDADKYVVSIIGGEMKNPAGGSNDSNVFSSGVNKLIDSSSGVIAVQFHPGSFCLHDGLDDLLEYGKILDHLKATGWTIMLPSEYVAAMDSLTKASAPVIITNALASGTVNEKYGQTLTATPAATSWQVTSGSLPNGVSLATDSSLNWMVSGTPSVAGIFSFTVKASNSGGDSLEKQFKITVNSAIVLPVITTGDLAIGTVNMQYRQPLTAIPAATSWQVTSGSLPNGVNLVNDSSLNWTLSGTPSIAGTFSFGVTAKNGAVSSLEKSFSITIQKPAIVSTPAISPISLDNGRVGVNYSKTLTATPTVASWSIQSGSLPNGMALTTGGVLSGVPSMAGIFTFSVNAINSGGATTSPMLTLVISANPWIPKIATSSVANGMVGIPYSQTLMAWHGATSWLINSGNLPDGVTLSTYTGVMSGTPTKAGTFIFAVTASNYNGVCAPQRLSITINASVGSASTLGVGQAPTVPTVSN